MDIIYINLDPDEVDIDDIEDFLATDDLFVEYFNAFLGLPSFPSPLCFNKDTGGFEVVNNARKEISKQIKAAIRSQKRTPKIYKPVKKHSYIDIPLIPIEEPEGPENVEINTSFTVTMLNKEQGIHWIKEERLPAFLESDLYLEFRLAKLISQSRITGEHGEYVLMRIDFIPRVKKVKKKEEDEAPKIDPKEQMIKDMYVSMGGATHTETDAWFTVAKITQDRTDPTFTTMSNGRPKSSEIVKRPNSARPVSAYSAIDSYRSESGMGTSVRGCVFSSAANRNTTAGLQTSKLTEDEDTYSSKVFATDGKPMTPRPSDQVCYVTDDQSGKSTQPFNYPVYAIPKLEKDGDSESGLGGDDDIDSLGSAPKDEEANSRTASRRGSLESIVFKNLDDLGAAIVGAVLRRSIAELTKKDEIEILSDPNITKNLPDSTYLTIEMLDRVSLVEEVVNIPESDDDPELKELMDKDSKQEKDKKGDDSDADSLLDSEDDYEEDRDTFFRTHKNKTYKLTDRKGIEQFKKFLKGTVGEKHWHLWVDIDRIQFLKKKLGTDVSEGDITSYLASMRDHYHKPGAPFELSTEQKMNLGLSEPGSWTLEKLQLIQNKIAEPLVLYWAPRFLIKQMTKSNPDKNELYHNIAKLKPSKNEVHPNPPTTKLLPLRPKSCFPSLRGCNDLPPKQETIVPATLSEPVTSPPVGLKRVYNVQAVNTPRQKQMISPKLPVPPRAKSARPKSSVKHEMSRQTSARPASARPVSSRPMSSNHSSSRVQSQQKSRPVSAVSRSSEVSSGSKSTPQAKQEEHKPQSRPSSAGSVSSVASSQSSEFEGSRRMEALLQALHHERVAGGFFHKFVEKSLNKSWINCLNFWGEAQQYHLLFYADTLNPTQVKKKAKMIYSQYIVVGAPRNIGVSPAVRREVYRCIDPPYEELFDAAEEASLAVLYIAWIQMIEMDNKTYSKVELIEVKKHLETKSKYVLNLQKKGLIKERVLTPDDPMDGYADPVYDESLIANIPEEFAQYTLEKLVHNRIELEHFRQFLNENYASMDLLCWMDIEQFRRLPHSDERKRDAKAKELKVKYLNKKYFFGPNSPAGKESQDQIMAEAGGWGKMLNDRPPNSVLLEAQKHVQSRLEKKWLPLFLVTPEFGERQKPNAGMDDVVDDVMVQKKKKSQAVLKLLESKWVSSSKEIITFRKALMNPVTSLQFRRYVSIKGDTLENDVLFWQEVQNFKNMNHAHADDSFVMNKISTIINCFIDSQIPPSLQVDISNEMAERILEHKFERNAYLFRESQFVVFRVLFSHWNDFCEFRANLADDKVLPTIERRRRHAKMKERQKQKQEEEKALREQEKRQALGLNPDDDLDAYHDPFAAGGDGGSEGGDEEETKHDKEKVSWSYSSYMTALQREEVLNNTDESTFSSLMSDAGSQKGSEKVEKESDSTKLSGPNNTAKETKSEQTQTDKRKSSRASPVSETEPKGNLKKRGSGSKPSVEFSKMPPVSEEAARPKSKSKVKLSEAHLTNGS